MKTAVVFALSIVALTWAYPRPGGRDARGCSRGCPLLMDQVCASNGHTYAGECAMEVAGCINGEELTVLHRGPCKGYRSRAAFKLIQLNRKFEFLQKCRVLVDLCAAPGGWMQVASQHMPVSSLIIGVDLYPIRPIPKTVVLQEDITTEKCRMTLKRELQTWKADAVLHDGAPNVGKNWIQDAFSQNELVLSALKLATEFLNKGGWFITKVFRSKDYQKVLKFCEKFFKKVHATKPQASRNESAEIFVICQGYQPPDKWDPKMFDPKIVFAEEHMEPKVRLNLAHPEKEKKKAEGYPEGDLSLYHRVPVSAFIKRGNYIELLTSASELYFDDEEISKNPLTTNEVKECCRDIKVLGRADLRLLLNWRKKMLQEYRKKEGEEENEPEEEEEDEEEKVKNEIAHLKKEEKKEVKKKRKKERKKARQFQRKVDMKMEMPNAEPLQQDEADLFRLAHLRNKQAVDDLGKMDMDAAKEKEEKEEGGEEEEGENLMPKYTKYSVDDKRLSSSGKYYKAEGESDSDIQDSSDEDEDTDEAEDEGETLKLVTKGRDGDSSEEEEEEDEYEETNPLLVDVMSKEEKRAFRAQSWFNRDVFKGVEQELDEDVELEALEKEYLKKGQQLASKEKEKEQAGTSPSHDLEENDDGKEEKKHSIGEGSSDVEEEENNSLAIGSGQGSLVETTSAKKRKMGEEKEEVKTAQGTSKKIKKKMKLDAAGMALGSMMIRSEKAKRDILDDGWNRFAFNDKGLPNWFIRNEEKHNRKPPPVPKELIQEYQNKLKDINVRTLKKVVEARERKKKRAKSKLERARKKSETITDNMDMSMKEKAQAIRQIYKRAMKQKKKDVTYVVSKKHQLSKRGNKPSHVKGPYRIVDRRMKKDQRGKKKTEKAQWKKVAQRRRKNVHS
ncbi:unnamed protein product [Darwinula stevensoni]|uniref:Putative rRNA methyltransferase n=1 Tax=Darwinula stevensoni TaxID=69355 RepID=A0A7R8X471_9CRUS|nr:unnamed protein product [Darwinula stevensoni]CAG0885718.1 unnamed protein product [Darwinula stevensoni]